MGIVQKIKNMSESGTLVITANYYIDNNQMDYPWYYVTYKDNDLEITSEMPTIEAAIESVYSQIGIYNAKVNTSLETWNKITHKGV
jgi:hypothetical protein